ncbi:MAG: DUF6644 family protein [Steroidobacteraceae bacterium]
MMQSFCNWLAATRLSQAFGSADWFVPAVQSIHILAIATVVTLLAMLNFRLLGVTRRAPAPAHLAAGYVPWVWRALIVLLITGTALTITEPTRELMNDSFRLKMLMVLLLVILTFLLRSGLRKNPEYWSVTTRRRFLGGAIALASLLLCASIVAAGRLIAYV